MSLFCVQYPQPQDILNFKQISQSSNNNSFDFPFRQFDWLRYVVGILYRESEPKGPTVSVGISVYPRYARRGTKLPCRDVWYSGLHHSCRSNFTHWSECHQILHVVRSTILVPREHAAKKWESCSNSAKPHGHSGAVDVSAFSEITTHTHTHTSMQAGTEKN